MCVKTGEIIQQHRNIELNINNLCRNREIQSGRVNLELLKKNCSENSPNTFNAQQLN